MSNHDLIFCESAANNMIDDIEHAASKMRDGNTDMSDLVDAELAEWMESSEARQAQKECAQRLNDRALARG